MFHSANTRLLRLYIVCKHLLEEWVKPWHKLRSVPLDSRQKTSCRAWQLQRLQLLMDTWTPTALQSETAHLEIDTHVNKGCESGKTTLNADTEFPKCVLTAVFSSSLHCGVLKFLFHFLDLLSKLCFKPSLYFFSLRHFLLKSLVGYRHSKNHNSLAMILRMDSFVRLP